MPRPKRTDILTAREAEILRMKEQGMKPKEIARRLGLSCKTVYNMIYNARIRISESL